MTQPLFPDRRFDAFLFDMDGTILTSIIAAERVWARWAGSHGLDVAAFLPTIHGRRSVETVRSLGLPGVDAQAEADAITAQEMLDVEGVEPIAGAAAFLGALPQGRWGIVTSGAGLPRSTRSSSARAGWACGRGIAWCSRMPRRVSPRPRPPAPRWW